MNKQYKIDWSNLKLIILPASEIPANLDHQMQEMGYRPESDGMSEAFFYVGDKDSPQTVRLYIGEKSASVLRRDCIERGISYLESIQMRLLVSIMEEHIHKPDGETAAECVMYARTLTRAQVNGAFRHLDVYSDDAQYGLAKSDVYALIQFIQRKI